MISKSFIKQLNKSSRRYDNVPDVYGVNKKRSKSNSIASRDLASTAEQLVMDPPDSKRKYTGKVNSPNHGNIVKQPKENNEPHIFGQENQLSKKLFHESSSLESKKNQNLEFDINRECVDWKREEEEDGSESKFQELFNHSISSSSPFFEDDSTCFDNIDMLDTCFALLARDNPFKTLSAAWLNDELAKQSSSRSASPEIPFLFPMIFFKCQLQYLSEKKGIMEKWLLEKKQGGQLMEFVDPQSASNASPSINSNVSSNYQNFNTSSILNLETLNTGRTRNGGSTRTVNSSKSAGSSACLHHSSSSFFILSSDLSLLISHSIYNLSLQTLATIQQSIPNSPPDSSIASNIKLHDKTSLIDHILSSYRSIQVLAIFHQIFLSPDHPQIDKSLSLQNGKRKSLIMTPSSTIPFHDLEDFNSTSINDESTFWEEEDAHYRPSRSDFHGEPFISASLLDGLFKPYQSYLNSISHTNFTFSYIVEQLNAIKQQKVHELFQFLQASRTHAVPASPSNSNSIPSFSPSSKLGLDSSPRSKKFVWKLNEVHKILIQNGFLTRRNTSSFWFSLPNIGSILKLMKKGRSYVRSALMRSKTKELQLNDLMTLAKSNHRFNSSYQQQYHCPYLKNQSEIYWAQSPSQARALEASSSRNGKAKNPSKSFNPVSSSSSSSSSSTIKPNNKKTIRPHVVSETTVHFNRWMQYITRELIGSNELFTIALPSGTLIRLNPAIIIQN